MICYLLGRDNKGKLRFYQIESDEEWHDGFIIKRSYGTIGGKVSESPDIVVRKKPASRKWADQLALKFESEKKKQLDKGYIELPNPIDTYTYEELDNIFGDVKTNRIGIIKPQLAKQYQDVPEKVFSKTYYGSRKINGVRCLIFYRDGEIHTSSRGSIDYDFAIRHIIEHPLLIKFFKNHPDYILDGEIYKFGWTLNKISGICRTQATVYDSIDLEFYLYDIVILDIPFVDRLQTLKNIKYELNLDFKPECTWQDDDLKIQYVPHVKVSGLDNMRVLHDKYVSEGWEGLVVRLDSGTYHPGNRGSYMIKMKDYFEKEYKILGISEGSRDEDMCFIMETESGLTFKAKPIGDRHIKQEYRDNIDNIIGKMGSVKYFEMSGKGNYIPQQPIFIAVRDYE